ncbi:MAG TPA: sigma-70 family RNA polymerase sigma factor [Terriglobales bacterium]|nr:sigma-70 family RNA polymerase sigma factor [Terriglobales bacterium]
MDRLRSGDPQTQHHFFAYFSELMQLKLRSRLRTVQAIEDVKQETFTRILIALRKPGGIRQPDRLGAYVNSMCNNVLSEQYRDDAKVTPIDEQTANELPDRKTDVEHTVAAKQLEEKVRTILNEMSERDRRIIREVFLEERDKDEVCRDFGVDRDYLRVLVHRAKQSFKAEYSRVIDRRPPDR